MYCTQLAGNAVRRNSQKNRRLGTIAQLCRAISSKLCHVPHRQSEKIVKQQYLPHVSPQYGELRPRVAHEIVSLVWGTPANFNGFRVLAALTYCTAL